MMIPDALLPYIYGLYGLLGINATINLVYFAWIGRHQTPPERLPRLSVLIPARNEETNLRRLLPTLTGQDYRDVEIIVYDDASSDNTSGVAQELGGGRVRVLTGGGPPPGWIGKPHACHRAAEAATGTVLLFLDADCELRRPDALRRLVARYLTLPQPAVLTGIPRFAGGGLLLVSMLTMAVLLLTPLPLAARLKWSALGALNGQCWMISRVLYGDLQPHARFPNEIVEDVMIGRWLLGQGIVPWAAPLGSDLAVWMYRSLPDAWRGFRKNMYLVSGRSVIGFVVTWSILASVLLVIPILAPPVFVGLLLGKMVADRLGGFPGWLWVLAPVTAALALGVYLDSAVAHWRGKVMWKGRQVLH